MLWYIGVTILSSFIALGFFIYHCVKGQFDDLEEVKYQMFQEED